MSNNLVACNHHLFTAYQLLQKGQLAQSIEEYQLAIKNTYSQSLKSNIKCTVAVLQYHLTKDNTDQLLQSAILSQNQEPNNLITIRAIINCILIDILEGRCSRATEFFEAVLEILQQQPCLYQRKNLFEYISFLFFRVRTFEEIPEYIENMDLNGLKIEEVFSISLMAFNSELCRQQSQQRVQRLCYEEYMKHKRYDLAIFCLRSLIKFSKNNLPNKDYYEKQLGKLIMLGYFDDSIDYQNYQSYEIMQVIIERFITFKNKLVDETNKMEMKSILSQKTSKKNADQPDKELILEWKYTISMMMKQLKKNKEMDVESKRNIAVILSSVKNEENILVIRSMSKNNYFAKYHEKVHTVFQIFSTPLTHTSKIMRESFEALKHQQSHFSSQQTYSKESKTQKSRLSLRSDKSRSALSQVKTREKEKQGADKQNNPPLGISIVSIASSKISTKEQGGRRKIFEESRAIYTSKKVQKMVKMCEYGGFLNKRNFNSEGGQYRFVKITNSFIKWGKDPEKIETSCQIYPLKDIKSIVYGRVSPNLNENCNKMLSYSKCFSLLLQKRTLDFYCKNYEQLEGWVCGLSAALKKQQIKVAGYSPGKLRWKKMFAILKQSFIQPLKTSERGKYYYQNAYSLILFAKNGYQLRRNNEIK